MTDYRSVELLEVYRADEPVGFLRRLPRGCEFRYSESFLSRNTLPIALNLPKTPEPLIVEGILNLPTFFAGLLPEGVMFTVAQRLTGSARDDLFAVLAATGRDAIGDVHVQVPGTAKQDSPLLSLESARSEIELILSRRGGQVESITGISGVQPKMSIGQIVRASRTARYIAKFPSPDFDGLPSNEFACMTLAKKCGLRVPGVKLQNGIYIVERFDREPLGNGTFRKLHVEDVLQAMDLFPNSKYTLDYVEMVRAMETIGVSKAGILESIKLYAFSYMIGNGDLHAKNVSLIRKPDGQWILSPAYDLLSTLPFGDILPGAHRMANALVEDAYGRFGFDDFTEFGNLFGIPEKATRKMVASLARAVHRLAHGVLTGALPDEVVAIVLSRSESLS